MHPWTPIATKSRRLTVATAAMVADDVFTEHGRVLRVIPDVVTHHFRYTVDSLRGGDFNRLYGQVWAKVVDTETGMLEGDVEGAALRGGPWREGGTTGNITLNKTSPLSGLRDAKMSLADTTTIFRQTGWTSLRSGVAYTLHHFYLQSATQVPHDVAIRYWNGTAYRWRSGAATWSTETWVTTATSTTKATSNVGFVPEASARHEVLFRPKPAGAATETAQIGNVYIVEDALLTDPQFGADLREIFKADGEGRFSFLGAAGAAGTVDISEVG